MGRPRTVRHAMSVATEFGSREIPGFRDCLGTEQNMQGRRFLKNRPHVVRLVHHGQATWACASD